MYNVEELNSIFKYSDESPSGLVYKVNSKNNKCKTGDFAGKIQKRKNGNYLFWKVYIKGCPFIASRIILTMLGYDLKNKIVDHLDGNPLNNRIENLRVCDYIENNRNKKKSKNNNSGETGIFFETIKNKYGKTYNYFVAFYSEESGKEVRKRFSIDKLGRELAFNEAKEFRQLGISLSQHYTERHGND